MSEVKIKPPDPERIVKLTPSRTKLVDPAIVAEALGAEEVPPEETLRYPSPTAPNGTLK
jgi:hypothetical protein